MRLPCRRSCDLHPESAAEPGVASWLGRMLAADRGRTGNPEYATAGKQTAALASRSLAKVGAQSSAMSESGCVIDRYQYLLLMGACLVVTLPLEWVLGARVYRRADALLYAVVPVVVVFSVWDIAGIIRDHWSYNPDFVTGIQLVFGMPLEELTFFIVIPICGLLTYEAVGSVLRRLRSAQSKRSTGTRSDLPGLDAPTATGAPSDVTERGRTH